MDTHRPSASSSSTEPTAPPEADNAVLDIEWDASGPATLQVPLPHLDSCLQPADWMAGNQTARNTTAVLRSVDRGQVVEVTGVGASSWSVQISTAGRPTCETFRYDPWSIDPDANGTAVEVRATAGSIGHASVIARWVRGGCGQATLYDGQPGPGNWTVFEGRTIPVGCAT
jgi:hypothetical protein